MNNPCESFEGMQHGRTALNEPRVTLGQKGTFYLNGIAYQALGEPVAVEMLYDGNRRIIGLKPTNPAKRNAFVIKAHGKNGNYKRISAAAFCTHFRIRLQNTVLFEDVGVDHDGVMRLDLGNVITVGRGAR